MLDMQFIKSTYDSSLFCKITSSSTFYLLIYMDDIIITGNDDSQIKQLAYTLHNKFPLKYLGIEVHKLPNGDLTLTQSKYIR